MNKDFHYYGTYAAARIAGYSHEEALNICSAAFLVDLCTRSLLAAIDGPKSAATTQTAMEMADARTDIIGLQDITRIWASFHFLPKDLYAKREKVSKRYLRKYRLICGPNGDLLVDAVNLAKDKSLEAVGVAMHVLADTWAHMNFAGTPSFVINNTNDYFFEITEDGKEKPISFKHNPMSPEDTEKASYTNSVKTENEHSVMNLGHGRAGHLPDYSFIKYKYLPAWANYHEVIKDNPSDYMHAFWQMVYAMRYLRGDEKTFQVKNYAKETVAPYEDEIKAIFKVRRTDDSEDWIKLCNKLSGCEIADLDIEKLKTEYTSASKEEKDNTLLGRFFIAAMAQKSMVTNKIYKSGNLLAGVSYEYNAEKGKFKGIKDFYKLIVNMRKGD